MPRQIHVTIPKALRDRCWQIAQHRAEPTTWQDVAREALARGLQDITPKKGAKP